MSSFLCSGMTCFGMQKSLYRSVKRALLQFGMCFIEVLYEHNTLINSSFSYVDIFCFLRRKRISVLLIGLLDDFVLTDEFFILDVFYINFLFVCRFVKYFFAGGLRTK